MMLGLRTADGVSDEEVASRTGLRPSIIFAEALAELTERGVLEEEGRWRLAPELWLTFKRDLRGFCRMSALAQGGWKMSRKMLAIGAILFAGQAC